jgi:hypothetical protein
VISITKKTAIEESSLWLFFIYEKNKKAPDRSSSDGTQVTFAGL